jgi:hypothetical protein
MLLMLSAKLMVSSASTRKSMAIFVCGVMVYALAFIMVLYHIYGAQL